jgi:hypothetical protein
VRSFDLCMPKVLHVFGCNSRPNYNLVPWRFHLAGLADIISFVDHFCDFSHPGMGVDFEERRQAIEAVFTALDIQYRCTSATRPQRSKAVGWLCDLTPTDGPPWILCTPDKFAYICAKLPTGRVESAGAGPSGGRRKGSALRGNRGRISR